MSSPYNKRKAAASPQQQDDEDVGFWSRLNPFSTVKRRRVESGRDSTGGSSSTSPSVSRLVGSFQTTMSPPLQYTGGASDVAASSAAAVATPVTEDGPTANGGMRESMSRPAARTETSTPRSEPAATTTSPTPARRSTHKSPWKGQSASRLSSSIMMNPSAATTSSSSSLAPAPFRSRTSSTYRPRAHVALARRRQQRHTSSSHLAKFTRDIQQALASHEALLTGPTHPLLLSSLSFSSSDQTSTRPVLRVGQRTLGSNQTGSRLVPVAAAAPSDARTTAANVSQSASTETAATAPSTTPPLLPNNPNKTQQRRVQFDESHTPHVSRRRTSASNREATPMPPKDTALQQQQDDHHTIVYPPLPSRRDYLADGPYQPSPDVTVDLVSHRVTLVSRHVLHMPRPSVQELLEHDTIPKNAESLFYMEPREYEQRCLEEPDEADYEEDEAAVAPMISTEAHASEKSKIVLNFDRGWGGTIMDATIAKQETQWRCTECTLLNEESWSVCKSCEAWKCPTCETVNLAENPKCSKCGTAKLKAVAQSDGVGVGDTDKSTSAGSIGASGFQFGGATPSADSTITATGFSFNSGTKPDNKSSAFSFGGMTSSDSKTPTFALGGTAKQGDVASTGFSFGSNTGKEGDGKSTTSFSFGNPVKEGHDQPTAFSFGGKTGTDSEAKNENKSGPTKSVGFAVPTPSEDKSDSKEPLPKTPYPSEKIAMMEKPADSTSSEENGKAIVPVPNTSFVFGAPPEAKKTPDVTSTGMFGSSSKLVQPAPVFPPKAPKADDEEKKDGSAPSAGFGLATTALGSGAPFAAPTFASGFGGSSTSGSIAAALGSTSGVDGEEGSRKKKRRGGTDDMDKETLSTASTPVTPSFPLGPAGGAGLGGSSTDLFGAPAVSTNTAPSSASTGLFGAPAVSTNTAPSTTGPTFTFGAPAGNRASAPPASDAQVEESSGDPAPPGGKPFSFVSTPNQEAAKPASSSAGQFGTVTGGGTPAPAAPAFTFGATNSGFPDASTANGLRGAQNPFGTNATPATATAPGAQATGGPTFGSAAPASVAPFGEPVAPAFGSTTFSGPVSAAPSFPSFGGQPSGNVQSGFVGGSSAPAPTPPPFGFGASASAAPASTPAFGFGGASSGGMPQASAPSGFAFGNPTAPGAPSGFGGVTPNANPTQSAGFSIGTSSGAPKRGRRIVRARRPPKNT